MSRMRWVTELFYRQIALWSGRFMVMSVPPSVPPKASPVPPRAAAPASAPGASARRHHGAELAPLLGRQYLGSVGHGLDEPLAGRSMNCDLVGADIFVIPTVYCLLLRKIPRRATHA